MVANTKEIWTNNFLYQRLASFTLPEPETSTNETYTIGYFMPEMHLRTIFSIYIAGFLLVMAITPKALGGLRLLLLAALALVVFRVFLNLRTISSETRKGIVTISPEGILDRRFGAGTLPWSAIDRIDMTPLPFVVDPPQAGLARPVAHGLINLLITTGLYGKVMVPLDFNLSSHRDTRDIRLWLRSDQHFEQTTPAARLRVRDSADGTQRVDIKARGLSVSRQKLLELIVAFRERYGEACRDRQN